MAIDTSPLDGPEFEVFAKICEEVAAGSSLKKALAKKGRPSQYMWNKWLRYRDPENDLKFQYGAAMKERATSLFEEAIAISHRGNMKNIARARLRVETLMRAAAKLDPQRYSDKYIHAGDKENPIETRVTVDPGKLSDEALKELMEARRGVGKPSRG